ncbi:MAG TPA: hypothetical protein VJR06_02820 [Nitrososphaerales archaeon]|nr:hypothetical protein [Nitrososphaerales archaeon]
MSHVVRFYELFYGVGGIRLGLERANGPVAEQAPQAGDGPGHRQEDPRDMVKMAPPPKPRGRQYEVSIFEVLENKQTMLDEWT